MRTNEPFVTVWRLVLEAATPLSIATGRGDGERDTVLAHDANGLPFIPATSMAGVLRALVRTANANLENSLFGHLGEGDYDGAMSRLDVSHAHIHDSHDHPVTGLSVEVTDPLLQPLCHRRNAQRQRVRINHRGAADDKGLFNRSVLPAGHRFTVEWVVWSHTDHNPEDALLEALLDGGLIKVGGQTRSGLGALKFVRGRRRRFNLRDAKDLQDYCALPVDLSADFTDDKKTLLPEWKPQDTRQGLGQLRQLRVTLTAESALRIGGGTRALGTGDEHPNADFAMSEGRVVWENGRGALREGNTALIPATAVKGALAHRVAFHANRLAGQWAHTFIAQHPKDGFEKALHCETIRRLFGSAGDEKVTKATGKSARAGVLGFQDTWLEVGRQVKPQIRMHTHIDRFTGGVRDGLLFGTEDLHAAKPNEPLLTLEITLDERRLLAAGGTENDLKALEWALADLCEGRLALGADSAGGLGFFKEGRMEWLDGRGWSLPVAQRTDEQGSHRHV